jgi:dipeptidyl aminopeptidase/acylaminoacyl peptidase
VLQLNHRGLRGRGAQFADAAKWRSQGRQDIVDGIRWAIRQGVADAERVCFYGSEHGALLAASAAADEPELFKCVIGVNGAYDTVLLDQAKSLKATVLLMHQRNEPDFPIEASSSLRKALQSAGNTPQWKVIGPDYIGFLVPSARAAAYRQILSFLDQQVGR